MFLIVGVDYFTKRIKVEPLAIIKEQKAAGFLWKNIIYCFSLPMILVTNNSK